MNWCKKRNEVYDGFCHFPWDPNFESPLLGKLKLPGNRGMSTNPLFGRLGGSCGADAVAGGRGNILSFS